TVDVVARLDVLEQPVRHAGERCCLVELGRDDVVEVEVLGGARRRALGCHGFLDEVRPGGPGLTWMTREPGSGRFNAGPVEDSGSRARGRVGTRPTRLGRGRAQCSVIGSPSANGAISASNFSPPPLTIWYVPCITPKEVESGQ